jgi:hypothetical protein
MIQGIIFLVGAIAGVSLIFGGVLALVVIIWAQDTVGAVRFIGNGYYFLVSLMPIVLGFALYVSHDDADYGTAYTSAWRAILTTLQGAIVGSILGAGPIFLAVVVNLPVILGDFQIEEFGPAVRDAIVWSRLSLAVGAAVISAIPLGLWAYHLRSGREDD